SGYFPPEWEPTAGCLPLWAANSQHPPSIRATTARLAACCESPRTEPRQRTSSFSRPGPLTDIFVYTVTWRPWLLSYTVRRGGVMAGASRKKSSRHSKIAGDFAEALVLYWLSKYGYECARVDHTGIDLIAREPDGPVMGISVKCRDR